MSDSVIKMNDPSQEPQLSQSKRPLLIRGGALVTMDSRIGVIDRGDVLVRGNTIEAIGANLEFPEDTLIVDATGMLVLPGFVDAHRHTWETVVRGVGGDWSLLDYFNWMVMVFGQHFRPEDIYAANLLAATDSLYGGITTIGDWADAGRTPDHVEAAVQALQDSGIRGKFHYANVYAPAQNWATTTHVKSMWDRFSSPTSRVSMQMGLDSTRDPAFPEAAAWRFAQDLGIPIATHAGGFGWDNDAWIGKLHREGFMRSDVSYIHVVSVPDEYIKMIADTGGTVIMATCSNCNAGQGYPQVTRLCKHSIPVALGTDTDMRWHQPIFDAMRRTLEADRAYQHILAHTAGHLQPFNYLRSEHVLEFATNGGARALGLTDQIGSITPGKLADLAILRVDPDAMDHLLNPIAHTVFQGREANIEMVLVDGRVVKYNGRLLQIDMDQVSRRAKQSRDYLVEQIGEDRIRAMMAGFSSEPDSPPPATL